MTATVQAPWIFDQPHYLKHIEARGALIGKLVPELKVALGLATALDAGCGPGFFAQVLNDCNLEVRGFDAREVNINQARLRYPNIPFETRDIEDSSIAQLGVFDLVLCFGLLYHLESPLRAIRHLRQLTGKVLLLESMCIPSKQSVVLLREEPKSDDQSLTDLAFYPSEECIVKMMHRAGFSSIYRTLLLPDHEDFRATSESARRRTVLVASYEPIDLPGLIPATESVETTDPWARTSGLPRMSRLAKKSLREKSRSARFRLGSAKSRWLRALSDIPVPVKLPFGSWWLARNDHVGKPIREGKFERVELEFVDRFIQPGMTVLDLGAHHGLYTLLASKRVGVSGKVFAFEPSPRERKALRRHLMLNRCRNVIVERFALGNENRDSDFYVVEDWAAGCNSLKPPDVHASTSRTRVAVARLDDWLAEHTISNVEFIKLDVEGAELDVLRGSETLLSRAPRPVILAEVQDIRTKPWGYRAKEIIEYLLRRGFRWFSITAAGSLQKLDITQESFDGNFVAVPEEFDLAQMRTKLL
jgi:FkbM family methyltransferase